MPGSIVTAPAGIPGLTLRAWAWVKFDGTVYASLNVASITKGGTGVYTLNFAAAIPAAQALIDGKVKSGSADTSRAGLQSGAVTTAAVGYKVYEGGAATDLDHWIGVYS